MSAAELLIEAPSDARVLLRWLRGGRSDAWLVATYSRSLAGNDAHEASPVVRVVAFGLDLRRGP